MISRISPHRDGRTSTHARVKILENIRAQQCRGGLVPLSQTRAIHSEQPQQDGDPIHNLYSIYTTYTTVKRFHPSRTSRVCRVAYGIPSPRGTTVQTPQVYRKKWISLFFSFYSRRRTFAASTTYFHLTLSMLFYIVIPCEHLFRSSLTLWYRYQCHRYRAASCAHFHFTVDLCPASRQFS